MLYDPKWEKPADVFSLESLIAWLEKQPATASYDYLCNGHCLMAQYFGAMGFDVDGVGGDYFRAYPDHQTHIPLPQHFNAIAAYNPRTFGAALDRAREKATP